MAQQLFENNSTLRQLRGRQIAVIPAIAQAIREGHRRIVIQSPTGSGKTVISAHLMDRSAKKGKRPMFVAPAIALVEQTLASFEDQGMSDIGVIQARHERTDFRAAIQIASRDTLVRRPLPEIDMMIIDEVHDQRAALMDIVNSDALKGKLVIGLSATPWSKGLGLHFTKLIVAATMAEMIADGPPSGLCGMRVFGVGDEFEPDFTGVKKVGDDLDEGQTARIMDTPKLVGNAVDHWLRTRQQEEHPGDRTFLRGVNRAHAKSLMEAFQAAGVTCGYVDGDTSKDDRKREFEKYRSRINKIIASVRVLGVGVDEDVRCMIDCAKTISEINHVQWWGRGVRLADGKTHIFGLDHGGNCTTLGMPYDIHHDTLDTREPKSKDDAYEEDKPTPKPRKCSKCHAIIPPATRACPTCGDVYAAENRITHEKGELTLLTSAGKKAKADKKEKQQWFSGLLYIAQSRGFKDGWVANKYRERFGVWPQGMERVTKQPIKAVKEFEVESRRKFIESKKAKEVINA